MDSAGSKTEKWKENWGNKLSDLSFCQIFLAFLFVVRHGGHGGGGDIRGRFYIHCFAKALLSPHRKKNIFKAVYSSIQWHQQCAFYSESILFVQDFSACWQFRFFFRLRTHFTHVRDFSDNFQFTISVALHADDIFFSYRRGVIISSWYYMEVCFKMTLITTGHIQNSFGIL